MNGAVKMAANSCFTQTEGSLEQNSVAEKNDNRVPQDDMKYSMKDINDDTTCGWFQCRPSCIQKCNKSIWFLIFLCSFALFQSTTVNGLVYVVITTLERRFSLTSARSGAISSTFDFTVLALIVFLTYLTERLHKPLLIGSGAVIFALGSYVFTLPHFLSPKYEAGVLNDDEICRANETAGKCDAETEGSLSSLYWYFIVGQVLHGVGACPLYTHGKIYIYENVRAQLVPIYFAILQLTASLGVAVGYLLGGLLLQTHTDLTADTETLDITPNSPLWIGNWWLGFIIIGTLALVTSSLPLTGFPKVIRGTGPIREENENLSKPQKGSEFYNSRGLKGLVRDFPRALWNLIRNIPLMCINFGVAAEFFIISCTTVFGPKFMETQFNLQAGTAALIIGGVLVPFGLAGVLAGGWIIKRFNLDYNGQAKLCVAALLVSLLLLACFLIGCPNVMFAGVTAAYDGGVLEMGDDIVTTVVNVTDPCNVGCNCVDAFAPVCGSDDVMYYSACHAGCSSFEIINGSLNYIDCSCIPVANSRTLGGMAIEGRCDVECSNIYVFLILVAVGVTASSLVFVPSTTMLLSVVSSTQRTTALGLQSLMFRAFGSVPGPIIFGTIIDNACLIWEDDCYGAQTCWMYRNTHFSIAAFIILAVSRSLSLTFFTAALISYKPTEDETDTKRQSVDMKTEL